MSNERKDPVWSEGTVAPGYEPVRHLFDRTMNMLAEGNAQLCVYVGEEKVVDLWSSATGDPDFTPDSLINVFSSGKSLEAIALASLVGRGLIRYDAKIAEYWPEFGAHGKDRLTVADLMRHEGGLAALNVSIDPADLLTENIKQNKVGRVIEEHAPKFRPGPDAVREYHAITRGWIANELFRRADPGRRTIGEFVREELAGPVGVDVAIGVAEDDLRRIAPISPVGFGQHLGQSLRPRWMGRRVQHNVFQLGNRMLRAIPSLRHRTSAGAPPPFAGTDSLIDMFNDPAVARAEIPSANAHSSARGLARVAAAMANGGAFGGQQLINAAAWHEMHAAAIRRDMGLHTTFTQGGVALFGETSRASSPLERAANRGREGFYGWMGLGGSIFQWHPEARIGFAFVPTSLHVLDIVNERGKAYQAEVLRCVSGKSAGRRSRMA